MRIPLSPHGTREILVAVLLGGGLAWLCAMWWPPLALIPLALVLFVIAFFRDPERRAPSGADVLVSPADGTVADIEELTTAPFLDEPCLRVGIFLSVFNVHVNRSPVAARVKNLQYRPGRFLDARDPRAGQENEAQDIHLEGECPLLVRQIAGLIARRIVCPLAVDQTVSRGERIGLIKFGSRTELYVPLRFQPEPLVKIGDAVSGASTALVRIKEAPA